MLGGAGGHRVALVREDDCGVASAVLHGRLDCQWRQRLPRRADGGHRYFPRVGALADRFPRNRAARRVLPSLCRRRVSGQRPRGGAVRPPRPLSLAARRAQFPELWRGLGQDVRPQRQPGGAVPRRDQVWRCRRREEAAQGRRRRQLCRSPAHVAAAHRTSRGRRCAARVGTLRATAPLLRADANPFPSSTPFPFPRPPRSTTPRSRFFSSTPERIR